MIDDFDEWIRDLNTLPQTVRLTQAIVALQSLSEPLDLLFDPEYDSDENGGEGGEATVETEDPAVVNELPEPSIVVKKGKSRAVSRETATPVIPYDPMVRHF